MGTRKKTSTVRLDSAGRCRLNFSTAVFAQTIPSGAAIDSEVSKIMARTHANGIAVAVIDHGRVGYVHASGFATPREIR